jgi:hypothetical protein
MRQALDGYVGTSSIALPEAHEMADLVSQLFAEDRREQRAVVDRQLRALRQPGGHVQSTAALPKLVPPPIPPLPRLEHTPTVPSVGPGARWAAAESFPPTAAPAPRAPTPGAQPSLASPAPTPPPTLPPSAPWTLGRGRVVAVAAVGAMLAAVATVVVSLALTPASRRSASEAAPARDPAVLAAPAEKMATTHTVIRATPPSVRLHVDDEIVANPYVADLPPDPRPHRVWAEADGYAEQEESVSFDRDTVIHLALAPAPRGAPPPVAHAVSAPARPAPALAAVAVRALPPPAASAPPAVAPPAPAPVAPPTPPAPPTVLSAVDAPAEKPNREILKRNPYLP